MASKIQIRRDSSNNWTSTNPTLSQGEPGYEIDTTKIKYGDGITPWNSLLYTSGTPGATGPAGNTGATGPIGSIVHNKLNSTVPECKPIESSDLKILNLVEDNLELLIKTFNKFEIHNYLKNIIQLCSEVNKYVNDSAPWSIKEDKTEEAGTEVTEDTEANLIS